MTDSAADPSKTNDTAPLAARFTRAPVLSDGASAGRKVSEWLDEIAGEHAAAVRDAFTAHPLVKTTIEAIAEASPYLWDLAHREPARFVAILQSPPEGRLRACLAAATDEITHARGDEAVAMRALRRMKGEAALLIALADIGGVWTLAAITQSLTEVADAAAALAVRFLLSAAASDGRYLARDPDHPEVGCGFVALTMGKGGAFELNYSSDIDLICLFDAERVRLAGGVEVAQFFIRLTRSLVRLLQERTIDGYVFRVDLRLRPDPGLTQIALSTNAALSYYESVGQNWERAALIKARPCAGDNRLGEDFLKHVAPFIWRKYLDYAAVADVEAMKRQMHAFRGHEDIAVEGHNIKLGRGGIREIEFFVQTQQLIAGGRDPSLRGRQTTTMLAALADAGWIDGSAARELVDAYVFLRTVEHRLQMLNDEQTHTLPTDPAALETFARFLGSADRDAFAEALVARMRVVQSHYAGLFARDDADSSQRATLRFGEETDDRETLDRLLALGFKRPLEVSATVRGWISQRYRSLRGESALGALQALVPGLLTRLAGTEDPDAAVLAMDRFLAGLHGGGRLLSLLRQNPDLLDVLAVVLGAAPRMADILCAHPQAMDAILDPSFFGALPDETALAAKLDATIGQSASYEDLLDRVRLFRQEQLFLVGARILTGTVSARQAGEAFARLADVMIRRVHAAVQEQFAQSHGRVPGQEIAIIAMGKLGGREMTASSDLDLIIVYDFDPEQPQSDGARPLSGAQYFARLTQRVIAALTTQTNFGALYAVDMRLRPSGRSGPVATHIASFAHYQQHEAWTWEHMALTRARVVSASPEFKDRVESVINAVLRGPRNSELIAADVAEMREAIAAEKSEADPWDLKYAAGGLVDLEFLAQYLQLVNAAGHPAILSTETVQALENACRLGPLQLDDAEVLRAAATLYQDLTQVLRLCLAAPFDPKSASTQLLRLLARAADLPDFSTLDAHLRETQQKVRTTFLRLLHSEGRSAA